MSIDIGKMKPSGFAVLVQEVRDDFLERTIGESKLILPENVGNVYSDNKEGSGFKCGKVIELGVGHKHDKNSPSEDYEYEIGDKVLFVVDGTSVIHNNDTKYVVVPISSVIGTLDKK